MSPLVLLILAIVIVFGSAGVVGCVVAVGAMVFCGDRLGGGRRGRVGAEVFGFVFPFALLGSCVGTVYPGLALLMYFGDGLLVPGTVLGAVVGAVFGAVLAGVTRFVMKRVRRLGPAGTAVVLLAGLIVFVWYFKPISYRVVFFVFSGKVFSARPIVTGGALDQPSLQKGFFIFCLFTVITGLYMVVVRCLADRERRRVRVVYRAVALLCLMPALCVLTATFYDVLRYYFTMGYTPRRVQGIVFVLMSYVVLFVFVMWSASRWRPWWLRPVRKGICPDCKYDLRGTPGHCPECGWGSVGEQGVALRD